MESGTVIPADRETVKLTEQAEGLLNDATELAHPCVQAALGQMTGRIRHSRSASRFEVKLEW
ncbi:hypothetical protein ACFTWM_16345 [Streptomyces bacillaris]|uniref:hypothetical protein n=1 Tax=Streptomyces bacillaris TaxID=68179 RepID=UPI0017803A91|nr:hypothetical protein GCM10010498_65900 [Streptomyces cavourensis]